MKQLVIRLLGIDGQPIKYARVKARLYPDITYGDGANTVFPKSMQTYTNEYGLATLWLYPNDVLNISDSKYLIEITKDGKGMSFLVRLTSDMPDSINFEDLLNRDELARKIKECSDPGESEGKYYISGGKLYI